MRPGVDPVELPAEGRQGSHELGRGSLRGQGSCSTSPIEPNDVNSRNPIRSTSFLVLGHVMRNSSLVSTIPDARSPRPELPVKKTACHAMPNPTISPCSSCVAAPPTLYETFQRILTVLPFPLSTPSSRIGCVIPFR